MRLAMKKLSASSVVVMVGLFALLASACGTPPATNTGPKLAKDQVLHMLWPTGGGPDITFPDPGQASDTSSIPIVNLLFDGLVTLNQQLQVENWGATKIDNPDPTTYVFTLRSGQKFSDGTPVKASDYAYAMNRSLSPCLNSGVNYYLFNLKDSVDYSNNGSTPNDCAADGVSGTRIPTLIGDSIIPDDGAGTLTLKLDAPAAYFLSALTYSTSYAVEASVVTGKNLGADDQWMNSMIADSSHATGQGGSGMFYIATWDHSGNMVLKANPNWWGVTAGKKPYLTEIDYKMISSSDVAYNTYLQDNTQDYSGGIPVNQLAAAKGQPDYHAFQTLAVGGISFNWKVAPFDNLDARQAFCLAINKDATVHNILKDADVPSWHMIPQGMPGYNPQLTGIDGTTSTGDNSTLAKKHWQAYLATLGGKPAPAVVYNYNPSSAAAQTLAESIVAQWNQVLGANATTSSSNWATALKQERAGTLQVYRWGWSVDYPDPQDFLTLLYDTHSNYNWQNASVPAADTLMESADSTLPADSPARIQKYQQAEQLLVQNVASCQVYQYGGFYRLRTRVHGYVENAAGVNSLDNWAKTYIADRKSVV